MYRVQVSSIIFGVPSKSYQCKPEDSNPQMRSTGRPIPVRLKPGRPFCVLVRALANVANPSRRLFLVYSDFKECQWVIPGHWFLFTHTTINLKLMRVGAEITFTWVPIHVGVVGKKWVDVRYHGQYSTEACPCKLRCRPALVLLCGQAPVSNKRRLEEKWEIVALQFVTLPFHERALIVALSSILQTAKTTLCSLQIVHIRLTCWRGDLSRNVRTVQFLTLLSTCLSSVPILGVTMDVLNVYVCM